MPSTSSQLQKKIIIILFSFAVLLLFTVGMWYFYQARASVQKAIGNRLKAIASTGASQIDATVIQRIISPDDFNSNSYLEIAEVLKNIQLANNLENGDVKILRRKGDVTVLIATSSNNNEIGKISKEFLSDNKEVWHTSLHNPGFAQYAEICGGVGIRISNLDELESGIKKGLQSDKASIVEIITDPLLI